MSARAFPDAAAQLDFTPMHSEDLDAVSEIERIVYPYPWTRGNFEDALRSGYQAWVAREDAAIDPERRIFEPDPLTPALSQGERARTGYDEINTASHRINNAGKSAAGNILGYFLLMVAVDEGHLLNISVRADAQGRGCGHALLDRAASMARDLGLTSILLEVRPSNARAIHIYSCYGFVSIGRRKAYYPAAENTREDAIVMRLSL